MDFLHTDDIWKFIRAKAKRDLEFEDKCQCTCEECGDDCNPFWKKKEGNNDKDIFNSIITIFTNGNTGN